MHACTHRHNIHTPITSIYLILQVELRRTKAGMEVVEQRGCDGAQVRMVS